MTALFSRLSDKPLRFEDERGWLEVLYEGEATVIKRSFSRANVFRGLHYQPEPSHQTKLIRVIEGRILDFVAEIEAAGRPLHRAELSPADSWVRIAPNLAHGFYALDDTLFEYVCDGPYDAESEQAFSILDDLAAIGIDKPILSAKDRASPPLRGTQ